MHKWEAQILRTRTYCLESITHVGLLNLTDTLQSLRLEVAAYPRSGTGFGTALFMLPDFFRTMQEIICCLSQVE